MDSSFYRLLSMYVLFIYVYVCVVGFTRETELIEWMCVCVYMNEIY